MYFCTCTTLSHPFLCVERWWGTYYIKGVTVRFGFDVLESRKFKQIVKNKATGTPHGMYIYNPYWLLSNEQKSIRLYYIHQRGAFGVARFDNLGNARALTRGTSDRTGSTFFVSVCLSDEKLAIRSLGKLY